MQIPPKNQKREADALSLPLEFELEQSGERARMVLGGLLFFIIVCWALLAFAPIRAVVVAAGAFKPIGEAVAIHHERGGLVAAVLVERGEVVKKDQPLLRLNGDVVLSELEELKVRRRHLELRVERLRAQLDDRQPNFTVANGKAIAGDPDAARNEFDQFTAARAAFRAELASLKAQQATKRAAHKAFADEAEALKPALEALDERFAILKTLRARGRVANNEVFAIATQRAEVHSRLASVQGHAGAAMLELEELGFRVDSLRATKRAEWSNELTEALSQRSELEEQIGRRESIADKLVIRAPVAGAVQSLGAGESGAVLTAGQIAAEIVPIDRPLVAQVRVSPDEIGHVKVGDEAIMRVTTFVRQQFEELDGSVTRISPTAFTSEDGQNYYEVELSLISRHPDNADIRALSPGMSVNANLLGDESSVLAYFFTPFRVAMELAFTSR